jgi:hypothetical protein
VKHLASWSRSSSRRRRPRRRTPSVRLRDDGAERRVHRRDGLVTPVAFVRSTGAPGYAAVSNPADAVPNAIAADGRSFSVSFRTSCRGTVPPAPSSGAPLPAFIH